MKRETKELIFERIMPIVFIMFAIGIISYGVGHSKGSRKEFCIQKCINLDSLDSFDDNWTTEFYSCKSNCIKLPHDDGSREHNKKYYE